MNTELQSGGQKFEPLPAVRPHAALKAIISEECRRIVSATYVENLRALVLTGSLARDEATFERQDDRWCLLGDADFFLVFRDHTPDPSDFDLKAAAAKIESRLAARGIHGRIGLSSVRTDYLRNLPPHIATYELRTSGQVLWGDSQILSLIPRFCVAEISKEDAWRMLCNRAVEFLEYVPELLSQRNAISPAVQYATVKLVLDSATSYLVFTGQYSPTYRERSERLRALADDPSNHKTAPFPLNDFSDCVSKCTEWKLSNRLEVPDESLMFWKAAIRYARLLWRWEMIELTGAPQESDDCVLWDRWARLQSSLTRARGWFSVARRRECRQSWRNWPRWVGLSCRTTPRYWLYRVAMELLWQLPGLVEDKNQVPSLDWKALRKVLPEHLPSPPAVDNPWQQLAADVVWNYKEFLVGTQA